VPPSDVSPEELRTRVAHRIRKLVWDRRLTLAQLAEEAGVSRGMVQAIVAGRKSPTLDTVAKLAKALGVDPIELLRAPRAKRPKATDG